MFDQAFYALDIIVAFSIPAFITIGVLRGRFSSRVVQALILGFLLGASWEVGFYFVGPETSSEPLYTQLRPFPGHPLLQTLSHSLWDAGLFMVGYGLVVWCCHDPFRSFRWRELSLMLLWGGLQELAVEIIAISSNAWTFNVKPWNPKLFDYGAHQITLIPQLIWFVAPILFYGGVLLIHRSNIPRRT